MAYSIQKFRKYLLPAIRNYPRAFFEKQLQNLRRLFPYPRVWARLFNADLPDDFLTGSSSQLARPEGLAFSPTSYLMAVSNTGTDSITVYDINNASIKSVSKPSLYIQDSERLAFVHDVAFTIDGKHVLTAGREAHALTMYTVSDGLKPLKEATMEWSVSGEKHGLSFPAGVDVHPSGDWIAVANRNHFGVTLYAFDQNVGKMESEPFQSIMDDDLATFNLSAPHTIDFSPDGNFLFVANKRFHKADKSRGNSALSVFECLPSPEKGVNPTPIFIRDYGDRFVHSVAVHAQNELVAVSDNYGPVELLKWLPSKKEVQLLKSYSFFRVGQGAKGVMFDRISDQLAVTTEMHDVLFYDLPPGD